jgi:hypothetical protein
MSLTTPIDQLLDSESENTGAQFAQMPGKEQELSRPITNELATGPSQGVSAPTRSGVKEFFDVKSSDFKTFILVFAILLIFTSGAFYTGLRPYVPASVGPDGKTTIVGSFVAAIIGSLLYLLIKFVFKF